MVLLQNTLQIKSKSLFVRTLSPLIHGDHFVLLSRQVQLLFRQPIGYWVFGGALLLISAGFAAQYHSFAQVQYHDLTQLSTIGFSLLHYYRLYCLLTIVIFVPLIGVSSIIQEREANTLDLMLTTAVPPLELVFSKVGASLSVVLIAILATSPILGLTLPMGGVGPMDIVNLVIIQIILALISVSVGIAMGARMPNFLMGLISSYGILFLLLSPAYNMISFGTRFENILWGYPTILFLIIFSLYILKGVPDQLTKEINKTRPISWRPISIKGVDAQLWTFLGTRDYGTPIQPTENPIYVSERERFLAFVTRRDFDAPSILWLISIFFFYWAIARSTIMLHLSMLISLFFVPGVGATMFSGEHQRASWESLRSSLITTRQIFWGKLRLTIGQGWIHAFAFYIPSLIIMGFIWLLIGINKPVSYFQPQNTFCVWVGHGLIMLNVAILIIFLSCLSLWISSICKTNFSALLFSFSTSAIFLYIPQFLGLMHPKPGPTLGGSHPMDWFSIGLSVWHSPYIFNLWPQASTQGASEPIQPLFWKLYLAHLILLLLGSILLGFFTHRSIKLSDD